MDTEHVLASEQHLLGLQFWLGIGDLWMSLTRRQKELMRSGDLSQAKPITLRALIEKGLADESGEITRRGRACLFYDSPKSGVSEDGANRG